MTGDHLDSLAGLAFWPGQVEFEPLDGRAEPRVLLARSAGQRFVVRLNRGAPAHGVVPADAARAARLAGEAGLGPAVRFQARAVLILDHVDGRHPTAAELADPVMMRRLCAVLARVQTLAIDATWPDRSAAATIAGYLGRLAGTPCAQEAGELARLVRAAWTADPAPGVPVHGDCHPGNLLWDGDRVWLIDWDHAGFGDVMADLASLAVNAASDRVDARFAETWFAAWETEPGMGGGEPRRRRFLGLALAAAVRDLLWGLAEEAAGESIAIPGYVAINRSRVTQWAALAGFEG